MVEDGSDALSSFVQKYGAWSLFGVPCSLANNSLRIDEKQQKLLLIRKKTKSNKISKEFRSVTFRLDRSETDFVSRKHFRVIPQVTYR